MAQCLGVAFDAEMPFTGRRLKTIRAIDPSAREPRLAAAELIALTDVDNPLTGAEGAARIYGPQKGATEHDVLLLDAGLEHLTRIAGDPGRSPGDGAAGGLGYGLRVFTGARLAHGMDFVLERVGFDRQLDGCELVLTGEGRLDAQTARGKVVAGVAERARTRGIPVIALAGALSGDSYALHALGLTAAFSLCNRPMKESEAMANTAELLSALADQVVRLWAARR
jgi:glycerate kinase